MESKFANATLGWFDEETCELVAPKYSEPDPTSLNTDFEIECPCCGEVIVMRQSLYAIVDDTEKK